MHAPPRQTSSIASLLRSGSRRTFAERLWALPPPAAGKGPEVPVHGSARCKKIPDKRSEVFVRRPLDRLHERPALQGGSEEVCQNRREKLRKKEVTVVHMPSIDELPDPTPE